MKPLAAEFSARMEEASAAKRTVSLSEDYRSRHTMMLDHFRSVGGWKPPEKGACRVEIAAKNLEYIQIDRTWQIPIRLLAVDDGVKYKVRARLREKKNVDRSMGRVADKYGFAAGLRVRWLPKADGRRRTEFARDRMKDDWAWYDLGEWDFSSFVICLNLHSKEFLIAPARMICARPSWARQEAKDSTGDVKP